MDNPTEAHPQADRREVPPVVNLREAAAALLDSAKGSRSGRAAHTLVPGAAAPLKQTLMALTSGTVLADHESPGTATLQVLAGSVRLTGGPSDLELAVDEHASIPDVRHGLVALDDAVVLISVGQGTAPAAG